MTTPAFSGLRDRIISHRLVQPAVHRVAVTAVDLAREALRWAYVGPGDRRRLGFAEFGDGSLLEQPWSILTGTPYISIGEKTLIAAGATLAASPEEAPDGGRPVLRIGSRVWAARGLSVVAHRSIEICDDVWFGPGVYVTDAGHRLDEPEVPIGLGMEPARPVRIGEGSWVGAGVVVLPGVTIGEHAAIGANAVVASDIPDRTVVAGVPARVLHEL